MILTMAYKACDRCGNWHRGDFSCETASRILDINGAVSECKMCSKSHPSNITCQMGPDWDAWKHSQEAGTRSVWDDALAEAWSRAQVVARLNNAIMFMDRTEATRKPSPCQPQPCEG